MNVKSRNRSNALWLYIGIVLASAFSMFWLVVFVGGALELARYEALGRVNIIRLCLAILAHATLIILYIVAIMYVRKMSNCYLHYVAGDCSRLVFENDDKVLWNVAVADVKRLGIFSNAFREPVFCLLYMKRRRLLVPCEILLNGFEGLQNLLEACGIQRRPARTAYEIYDIQEQK